MRVGIGLYSLKHSIYFFLVIKGLNVRSNLEIQTVCMHRFKSFGLFCQSLIYKIDLKKSKFRHPLVFVKL